MDIIAILRLVIRAMEQSEKILELDGEGKKNAVLLYLKLNLVNYDKYEDIVIAIIEVVIVLSKTKVLINLKKKVNLLCCV
jgi:hypothetical protein